MNMLASLKLDYLIVFPHCYLILIELMNLGTQLKFDLINLIKHYLVGR